MPGFVQALILPDTAFKGDRLYSSPRAPLFLVLFLLVLTGAAFTVRFHQNDTRRLLVEAENMRRLSSMMENVPQEGRDAMLERASSNRVALAAALIAGLVFGSLSWLLLSFEIWLLNILLMQFLGGEESPIAQKKHRRSQYLSLYCLIPLGLQELLKGVVFFFKDANAIENVLTLQEYNAATRVSFSLITFFGIGELDGLVGFLLHGITNPFFLWVFLIAIFGGRSIFRIGTGKMVISLVITFTLIGVQNQLLGATQGILRS